MVSLVLVSLTVIPILGTGVLPGESVSGTDLPDAQVPGVAWRIAYIVVGLMFLAVPVGVVVFARRRWLGWTLVALAASGLILGAGLWALGII